MAEAAGAALATLRAHLLDVGGGIARLADPRLAPPPARRPERTGFEPAEPRYAAVDACRR